MNKTFKKVLSVVLSLAMIAISVTVYHTTAKADDPVEVTVTATKRADGNGLDANWTKPEGWTQITENNPDGNYATLAFYLCKADEIVLDENHYAAAANGWCWTTANNKDDRTALDTVTHTKDSSLNVADGGNFVIVVQYLAEDGTVVAQGTSNAVEFEKVINTNLNLRQDRIDEANKLLFLKWDAIAGAARYDIIDADTEDVLVSKTAGDWEQFSYEEGKTYNFIVKVYDAEGSEIEVTNNTFTFFKEVSQNFDAAVSVVYGTDTATVSWKAITGATSYVVSVNGSETPTSDTHMDIAVVENEIYTVVVKALTEESEEISITNNTIEVQLVPEEAPEEHDLSKVDTSSWVTLEAKEGSVLENAYSINGTHGLDTGVWWGIYAPHSKAPYHGDRVNCILGEASAFVFKQTNVEKIWVNGNKYENHSIVFNNDGDCVEISTEVFTEEQNVVTIVMNDGTMKTFAIKVEAPLEPDATQKVEDTSIDPDTISEWTQLSGTSVNGSTVYASSVENMGNAGLRGFYNNGNPDWNRVNTAFKDLAVFGFVTTGSNASSIIIGDTEYINAKDARNTQVYIGSDCVYINQSLVEAQAGETKYFTITAVGSNVAPFVIKVVGPEPAPTYTVTVDGEPAEMSGDKVTLGNAAYGYFCDGKMYAPNSEVTVETDMVFTSVNELSVTMADGAGIRYIGTAGIRFQSTVLSDNMDAVASNAITEGTLITANDIYEAKGTDLTLTSDYTKLDVVNSGWYQDTVGTYCGSICDVVESNYIRNFTARAYVTINYENGDAVTVYSSMGPVRSISQVASAVKAAGYIGIAEEYQSTIDSFIK